MSIEPLHDRDGSLEPLADKTVATLGDGSSGRVQNLRDSGFQALGAESRLATRWLLAPPPRQTS